MRLFGGCQYIWSDICTQFLKNHFYGYYIIFDISLIIRIVCVHVHEFLWYWHLCTYEFSCWLIDCLIDLRLCSAKLFFNTGGTTHNAVPILALVSEPIPAIFDGIGPIRILYMAKLSRGKTFTVVHKTHYSLGNFRGASGPCHYVLYMASDSRGKPSQLAKKPWKFSPSKVLPYTVGWTCYANTNFVICALLKGQCTVYEVMWYLLLTCVMNMPCYVMSCYKLLRRFDWFVIKSLVIFGPK